MCERLRACLRKFERVIERLIDRQLTSSSYLVYVCVCMCDVTCQTRRWIRATVRSERANLCGTYLHCALKSLEHIDRSMSLLTHNDAASRSLSLSLSLSLSFVSMCALNDAPRSSTTPRPQSRVRVVSLQSIQTDRATHWISLSLSGLDPIAGASCGTFMLINAVGMGTFSQFITAKYGVALNDVREREESD